MWFSGTVSLWSNRRGSNANLAKRKCETREQMLTIQRCLLWRTIPFEYFAYFKISGQLSIFTWMYYAKVQSPGSWVRIWLTTVLPNVTPHSSLWIPVTVLIIKAKNGSKVTKVVKLRRNTTNKFAIRKSMVWYGKNIMGKLSQDHDSVKTTATRVFTKPL